MSASAAKNGGANARTYYPDQYFNRVGYKQGQQGGLPVDQVSQRSTASRGSRRVDALGQRVRERFNEELAYPAEGKKSNQLKARNLPNKSGLIGEDILSRKSSEVVSRVQSAIASRRSALAREVHNRSVVDEREADRESIVTKDNLKQFNVM